LIVCESSLEATEGAELGTAWVWPAAGNPVEGTRVLGKRKRCSPAAPPTGNLLRREGGEALHAA